MKLLHLLLFCSWLCASQHCVATENLKKVSQYFSGNKKGVTFYNKAFEYSWTYSPYDGRRVSQWIGGDSYDPPAFVVSKLSLTLDGKEIEIPRDLFWDLYDPQVQGSPPYIMEDKEHVYMVIHLSDGAGSRTVFLKFRDGKCLGREIPERE